MTGAFLVGSFHAYLFHFKDNRATFFENMAKINHSLAPLTSMLLFSIAALSTHLCLTWKMRRWPHHFSCLTLSTHFFLPFVPALSPFWHRHPCLIFCFFPPKFFGTGQRGDFIAEGVGRPKTDRLSSKSSPLTPTSPSPSPKAPPKSLKVHQGGADGGEVVQSLAKWLLKKARVLEEKREHERHK